MSSLTQRTARGRRSRVVVVGDGGGNDAESSLARLDSLLAQPAEQVANIFEAIGQITASGSGESIAAVIVTEGGIASPHERAAEAIKRVDPSVRVLGFTESMETPNAGAMSKSIDAWLTSPLRADDLKRAMDDDGLLASLTSSNPTPAAAVSPSTATPAAASASSNPGVIDLPDDEPAVATVSTLQPVSEPAPTIAAKPTFPRAPETAPPARPPAVSEPEPAKALPSTVASHPQARSFPTSQGGDNGAPSVSPSAPPESPSARNAPQTRPTLAAAIGDTDLLHAMMHDAAGLAPLALKLIAHHAGLNNVRVVADASSDEATTNDGVQIALGAQRFGTLVADHATPALLRSWADWLANWLNIEAEFLRLRNEANCDELTGAGNRRFFNRFLTDAIARARPLRRPVTVMVFDIDNFKPYNDRFGHEAGDDILREIVRLMQSVVRQGDIVCRIGGDEFAVVFADPEAPRTPGSSHPESVESIARRFQQAVCSMRFPKLGQQALGTLSVSAGLASFPWDGQDVATLLRLADQRALESKRKGKNAITFGPEIGG